MKKMYLINGLKLIAFLLFLSALFLSSTLKAQNAQQVLKDSSPEQRAEMQSSFMKKELSLSDAQYKQVSDLNLEYAKKMQPVLTSGGNRLSKAKQAKSLIKEKEGKLKKILSTPQFEQYQTVVREKMESAKAAFSNRKKQ